MVNITDKVSNNEDSITTNIPSSLGTAGQVLTVNSGATAGEWADAAGGAYTLIANQSISSSTTQYNFTGLSSYKHLQVIVSHTTTGGSTQASIIMGLSSGSAAQNPRDDNYKGMQHNMEVSGGHNVANHSTSGIYIGSADANKPYYINCSIMNFNDASERTSYHFNVSANQSFNYGFNGSGFIDYAEAYDYIRVNLNNSDSNSGTILVLGVVA